MDITVEFYYYIMAIIDGPYRRRNNVFVAGSMKDSLDAVKSLEPTVTINDEQTRMK